jgi:hypothetical protein
MDLRENAAWAMVVPTSMGVAYAHAEGRGFESLQPLPRILSRSSTIATARPRPPSRAAASSPAGPPPITMTSKSAYDGILQSGPHTRRRTRPIAR